MLVFGTQFYGKVDRVPGLFYVVTRFGHLWFIPLFPVESYLILDLPGETGKRGKGIPMHGKSVLHGWLRAACIVTMAVSVIVALIGAADHAANGDYSTLLTCAACFAIAVLLLVLSYRSSMASPERAIELAKHLGISEETMQQFLAPQEERMRDAPVNLGGDLDISPHAGRARDDRDDAPPNTSIRPG